MFDLFLLIVLIEASDGGKHHSHLIVGLRVQLLKKDISFIKNICFVSGAFHCYYCLNIKI